MAKNTNNGSRIGVITNRTQTYNPKTKQYIKRNTENGQFISTKATPFKSVRKEINAKQLPTAPVLRMQVPNNTTNKETKKKQILNK